MARADGVDVAIAAREARRRAMFHFDPQLKLMTTVDEVDGRLVLFTKGAPEEVMKRVARIATIATSAGMDGSAGDGSPGDGGSGDGSPGERPVTSTDRRQVHDVLQDFGSRGLRVLALARRRLPEGAAVPAERQHAERDLCLVGLVAMQDPPRREPAEPGLMRRPPRPWCWAASSSP
jgi:magnesium-transporting ATPase (P-type)